MRLVLELRVPFTLHKLVSEMNGSFPHYLRVRTPIPSLSRLMSVCVGPAIPVLLFFFSYLGAPHISTIG